MSAGEAAAELEDTVANLVDLPDNDADQLGGIRDIREPPTR